MTVRRIVRFGRRNALLPMVGLLLPAAATAQTTLPFGVGERLTYHVRVDRMRASGRGTMWIEGPLELRGSSALLLRSSVEVGIGPIKAIDKADSWLDPSRMTALKFEQRHRYLFSRRNSEVEIYPEEMRWQIAGGGTGTSLSDAPLDELSFIYYIRTLALDSDSSFELDRHYDASRNPVGINIAGRDIVRIPLGEFPVVVVELRVKDPRLTGDGLIRLYLSDDVDRVPVRIESTLPGVGTAVFTLESFVRAPQRALAIRR